MRHLEIFVTSGPTIRVWLRMSFKRCVQTLREFDLVAEAYEQGAYMGDVLFDAKERRPQFLLCAVRNLSDEFNLVGSPPTSILAQMTSQKPSAMRRAERKLC